MSGMSDDELVGLVREAIMALDKVTGLLLSLEHGVSMTVVRPEADRWGRGGPYRPMGKPGPKPRSYDVDVAEALRRHRDGEPMSALATSLGVPEAWLYGRLHELDPGCSQASMLKRRQDRYAARMSEGRGAWQASKVEDVAMARDLWLEGSTLQEIGDLYGLTRERIRQVVEQRFPGTGKEARRRRMERADAAKAAQQAQEDAAIQARVDRGEAPPCKVCRKPNVRALTNDNTSTTCGDECAQAWPLLRYYLEEGNAEKHRMQMARWALTNPKAKPAQLAYARRVLAGEVTEPVKHFGIKAGSKVEALARRLRPDLLEGRE
jgi:hypothetical protein